MYEHMMRELNSGAWADVDPARCPCRNGWLLSDLDTWHRCPVHGQGVPHPEDETDNKFDMAAHHLANLRNAYTAYRASARRNGFKGNFKAACVKEAGMVPTNPSDWVTAAERIAEECRYGAEETQARRRGFGSALEMRLADEAVIERLEAEQGWY